MLSNPVFSKLGAAIIALLVLCGAAIMIEANHRILIVAPETPESAAGSNVDRADEPTLGPASAPTIAPAEALHLTTQE